MTSNLAQVVGGILVFVSIIMAISLLMKAGMDQEGRTKPVSQTRYLLALLLMLGLVAGSYKLFIYPLVNKEAGSGLEGNDYAKATSIILEPTPYYTTQNNLSAVSRENLLDKMKRLQELKIKDLERGISTTLSAIQSAPSSGQTGLYDMQMTSSVKETFEGLKASILEKTKNK